MKPPSPIVKNPIGGAGEVFSEEELASYRSADNSAKGFFILVLVRICSQLSFEITMQNSLLVARSGSRVSPERAFSLYQIMTTPTTTTIRHCSLCKTVIPIHGCNRCKKCNSDYLKEWRRINRPPKSLKPPKVKKIKASVDPELIIDCPGIWEIQNRGRGTKSFNFTSLVDSSTFSFPTFKEARQARQSMMDAFRQQSRFDAVVRQSTGKKRAGDVEDDA